MSQREASNPLRTWEFGGYTYYSEWPKVADAVIEALQNINVLRLGRIVDDSRTRE